MQHIIHQAFQRVPAALLVLIAVISVQFGAALARPILPLVGEAGTVFLRMSVAIFFLTILVRPRVIPLLCAHWRPIVAFGVSIALSTLFFYAAVRRIPLGVAIAVEFIGPLGVAMLQSKSWRERMWVVLAALSISLLVPEIGTTLDGWGIVAALVAGVFWGTYILTSPKVSAVSNGFSGLVASLWVAWCILLIPGVTQAQWQLLNVDVLWQSVLMGLAAAVIPFTFETNALQRLPARTYGVLVCTEPIAGALIGFLVLQEALTPRIILAILGVTVAAIGTTLLSPASTTPPPAQEA